MRRTFSVLLGLWLAVACVGTRALAAAPDAPALRVAPRLPELGLTKAAPTTTACAQCHTTARWSQAAFPHERTGFPLLGRHARAACSGCHVQDYQAPLPKGCAGCHRDVHAGELGQRCEGCHDEQGWQARFEAEAHRRVGFPLTGGHAAIPCTECHAKARGASFLGTPVDCAGCHLADYQAAARRSVDHVAAGFSTRCSECHLPSTFRNARFAAHDACFLISSGQHSNLACRECHRNVPSSPALGTCTTGTASCSGCHAHRCARSDAQHEEVAGYQCRDRKCYECHAATVP